MAIVSCKECNKEVAASTKVCPHCGVKQPGVTAKQKAKAGLSMLAALFIGSALLVMLEDDDKPGDATGAAASPSLAEEDAPKWAVYGRMTDCELATDMVNGAGKFLAVLQPFAVKDSPHTLAEFEAAMTASNFHNDFDAWRGQYPTIASGTEGYPLARIAVTEVTFPLHQLSFYIAKKLQRPDDDQARQSLTTYAGRILAGAELIAAKCAADGGKTGEQATP